MNIYLRKVASEGINHHVEHCIFVPASRVLFSSRCPTFRVSLLSSFEECFLSRATLDKSTAQDHVGVLDLYFQRSEHGALQVEHSYRFHTTSQEFADAAVSRVIEKWKVDGDEDCVFNTFQRNEV